MSDSFATPSPPQESPPAVPPATTEKRAHKEQPRVRRRNRLITSCLECRRRKLKCDKQQPCTNCTKFSRPCVFIAPGLDPEAQAKLAEVKEKMGMLERTLEDDVAQRSSTKSSSKSRFEPAALPGQDGGHSDQEEEEDAKDLEISKLIIEDTTYYEDEGNDDIVDLGVSMGKLRITERIGGLVRPRISEELAQAFKSLPQSDAPNPFASQGSNSWMSPSNDYVAPSSGFFFAPGVEKMSLMTYLPSKGLVDKLMAHYWQAVHPIARTVHRSTFERHYEIFWKNVSVRVEPRISFQAVLFAALLSSVISMTDERIVAEFGVDKQSLVDSFRSGAESALARANFLRTTKLETLQAFVMYLIPLCRAEVSRAHSALTGTCIRLAECMGLHRDPSTISTNPVEIQVRRLIWFQICFLDLRTCEATGPRPQIRRDEYDTRFPLNVDDADLNRALETGVPVTEDSKHFTDMTITRMRLECYEMHRLLWTERIKLQKKPEKGEKRTTLTSVLSRIQAFKAAMERTYLPMLNKSQPQHGVAMEIYGILSTRLYVMVLHPFASSERRKMPDRLRQIMLSSCLMILEHSMAIERQPALAQWAWYVGALHQHHTALLLVSEMYEAPPEPALAGRIWRCVDYSFDLPENLSPVEKLRLVLGELSERTSTYAAVRRMRAPSDMPHAAPREKPIKDPSQQLDIKGYDDRERSSSVQSDFSGYTNSSSSQSQNPYIPSQGQQTQTYTPPSVPSMRPVGAIPQTDWGNFNMNPTATQQPPLIPATDGTYNFGGFATTAQTTGAVPTVNVAATSDTSSPAAGMGGGSAGGSGSGGSPMDALINDIDWNEWEQLFGSAQMGAGNIMIPPFTFPSFEPNDMQWYGQEGRGMQ